MNVDFGPVARFFPLCLRSQYSVRPRRELTSNWGYDGWNPVRMRCRLGEALVAWVRSACLQGPTGDDLLPCLAFLEILRESEPASFPYFHCLFVVFRLVTALFPCSSAVGLWELRGSLWLGIFFLWFRSRTLFR